MCVRFYRFCRTKAFHHPFDRRQHGQPAQGSHLVSARQAPAPPPSVQFAPTALLCLQFQPNRRPFLRVVREALRETADGCGGDLRLRCGVRKQHPHRLALLLAHNLFDIFTYIQTHIEQSSMWSLSGRRSCRFREEPAERQQEQRKNKTFSNFIPNSFGRTVFIL